MSSVGASALSEPTLRVRVEDDRTGMVPVVLERAFMDHLYYSQGRIPEIASPQDFYKSLALLVRDRLVHYWIETQRTYVKADVKRLYYLSAEFLLGRALGNNLLNLGIYEPIRQMLSQKGISLSDLLEQEPDAGLGNGGLGRLAACYLDSLSTLNYPAYGYGIRYQFGIFEQVIRDGFQLERPETWLKNGNPWEIVRPDSTVRVDFYGRAEHFYDEQGYWRARWVDTQSVLGIPYDTPISGFGTQTVNTLRLWQAAASEEFDLELFNDGDYERAVADKNASEVISKVLYPNDKTVVGKELRLKQQYFFVRCALVDILRRHLRAHPTLDNLADKAAVQLNDTHPSIAVAELMRILVDEHLMPWEKAWAVTTGTLGYTNHTVLPEALETWSVQLLGHLLPRHLEIIYEINRRLLEESQRRWPSEPGRLGRLSLIQEGKEKRVRMAHLAIVGSHSVNGVAALHTEILRQQVFRDFSELYPERFNNKTNGVTPRRWLLQCNPALAQAITERIGQSWCTHLEELEKLKALCDDPEFRAQLLTIKQANKQKLAERLKKEHGFRVDPHTLFDMQIKRMHEYKRQLLNVLHIVALYVRERQHPGSCRVPRSFFFAGKAAPGYQMAKLIIKLIHAVGQTLAKDGGVAAGLAVHFVPNYRVSLAERLIPACELSEQISTAGMEASGTGNMKLALNGALTIGTLDGANVEIRQAVGAENFFLFGWSAQQVEQSRHGAYDPKAIYQANPELREVLDLVASGHFSPHDRQLFRPIVENLLSSDPFRVLADFASYVQCQRQVEQAYLDRQRWARSSILNLAQMGRFSSDRAIQEYAKEIWSIQPQSVVVPPYLSTDSA